MLGRRAARLEAPVAAEMDAIIAMLQADIARLDSMVEDYLAFGTGHLLHKGHFEVDALLSSVGARWGEECERAGVTLTVDPAAGVTLQADARKLEQVLVNLIKNAIEAMPTGGAIALRSRFVEGAFVEIDVSDTGQGMPDTERIFEPFFTTKSKGTGLGLPIVREIVRMHGGRVNVASTPGKGTTMTLRIPYAPRD
jgi:signal transduction histidine kinase